MCNICGNQNLLLFWKAWPGGIELCSKMQLAGNDYRCILICMFACWKKFCYAALTAKTFANFAPFLDPKMEVEKWTQKWCQNLTPKMGSKNGTQKGGPIFFWFKNDLQEIKALFKILGLPFGCHFWTPFFKLAHFSKVFAMQLCTAKTFSSKQTFAYPSFSATSTQFNSTWSSLPE